MRPLGLPEAAPKRTGPAAVSATRGQVAQQLGQQPGELCLLNRKEHVHQALLPGQQQANGPLRRLVPPRGQLDQHQPRPPLRRQPPDRSVLSRSSVAASMPTAASVRRRSSESSFATCQIPRSS